MLLNTFLITKEIYWFLLLPFALLFVLLLVFYTDKTLFVTVFLVPLSINLEKLDFGLAISIPAEPLMMGLLLVIFLVEFFRPRIDKRIFQHPLSILIGIHLVWFFFTAITSEMPIVSFKAFASRLWFIIPFYFLGAHLFRDFKKIELFFWLSLAALTLVIGYATIELWSIGFDEKMSQSVMTPFYPSHTAYGAVIALFLPFLIFKVTDGKQPKWIRLIAGFLVVVFCIGIILSSSRAVWASLPAALVIYLALIFKIRFKAILIACLAGLGLVLVFQKDLIMALEKNKQDSSEHISENLQSISNISTDDSNTERINRWNSAISMFKERPIFGWGPGTYQFQYAPFQKSKDLTLISTNAGSLGNAHSEYLSPLAERGLIGAIIFLSLVFYSVLLSFRIYINAQSQLVKLTILSVVLGLTTYYVHGFMNNYLDTEKAAIPFWGFMAMITALDLFHNSAEDPDLKKLTTE